MNTPQRPIAELIAERKALAKQLEQLDAELFQRIETMASTMANVLGYMSEPVVKAPAIPPPPVVPRPGSGWVSGGHADPALTSLFKVPMPQAPTRPAEIGSIIQEHATRFIREAGRPLKTREIFNRLIEAGVAVPGKDPLNNLSAHLSRSSDFVNSSNGWSLSSAKGSANAGP